MKRDFIITVVFILFLTLLPYKESSGAPKSEKISFTKEEESAISVLKKREFIVAATRKNDLIGENEKKNTLESFNYRVLKEVADILGVDLKIEYVEMESFFAKEGHDIKKVISGEDSGYTPDIFKRADIIIGNLTVTEWRKKLIEFIEITPNRQILVVKKEMKIGGIKELNGKKFVTVKYTTMENTMKELEKKYNISVEYIYTDKLIEMEKYVEEGEADFTIDDAISAVMYIKMSDELKIMFPVSSIEYIGWGVSRENKELASVISKCIKKLEQKGKLGKEWVKFYGIGISEYNKMIEY